MVGGFKPKKYEKSIGVAISNIRKETTCSKPRSCAVSIPMISNCAVFKTSLSFDEILFG